MKIIADENMPFVRELFSNFGEVQLLSGRLMNASQIADADLLLVRSVTSVNAELLTQARNLQFVGSATAGIEHMDIAYLRARGIPHANAPGCNRLAVAEYVLSAVLHLSKIHDFELAQQSFAIIGAGYTGSAVADKLTALGVGVLLCDPPLEQTGDPRRFVTFERALRADIVSLHVPLSRTGSDATWHLLDQAVLEQFKNDQYLINASRGAVIDNQALLAVKSAGKGPVLVLDVWESEPDFEHSLLPYVSLATPHIAGYSLEGKARGTLMLYAAVSQLLHTPVRAYLRQLLPPARSIHTVADSEHPGSLWQQLVPLVYDITRDDRQFRRHATKPGGFDRLRRTYWGRREFSSLKVTNASPEAADQLSALGFYALQN